MVKFKLFIFVAFLTNVLACVKINPETQAPNVLIILTDDMGYGDYSCKGNPYLKTPVLDKLSEESVNFEYFYVSPVCAPTRASLLTGQYHQRNGVRSVTNGYETMNPDATTLAEILKQNGYSTGIFGKWHLGEHYPSHPNAQGFDEYFGFRTGHTDYYFDPVLEHNGKMEETRGYITDVLTDRAIGFIKNRKQPFFCYLAYNAPHTPLQIDSSKYSHFLNLGLPQNTSKVYGMIENIDENLGKLFSNLKELNVEDNTIIVFLSDNGPITSRENNKRELRFNSGLRDQKFSIYEGGIRTQCFWKWKGKWAPLIDTVSMAAHIDIVPTLLDVLNIENPGIQFDGISLITCLNGDEKPLPERTFFENFHLSTLREIAPYPGGIAIREKWKMVNGEELYNLATDPGEQQNLAATHPELLEELNREYIGFYKTVVEENEHQPGPLKVGFDEENPVFIAPHHGKAYGNLKFKNPAGNFHPTGVDGSYLTNWLEAGDKINWKILPVFGGQYEIEINYRGEIDTCLLKIVANEESKVVSIPATSNKTEWTSFFAAKINLKPESETELAIELVKITKGNELEVNTISLKKY